MSSGIRTSAFGADKRANGTAAAPDKATSRPRMSGHESFKSDTRESRRHVPSPDSGVSNPAHKRSASGNFRPSSRTVDERRTERVQVTTRETLVTRTRSPERRGAPSERPKAADTARQRASVDSRIKEIKVDPPVQGTCSLAPPGSPCEFCESRILN